MFMNMEGTNDVTLFWILFIIRSMHGLLHRFVFLLFFLCLI